MANEYVTLEELKSYIGVLPSDDTRDTELDAARGAASRGIDKATGRRFWLDATATARTFRLSGRIACDADGELLLVDDIGDATGMVVESGSGGSFTAITGYETSPDNALADGEAITGLRLVTGGWGMATNRVRITAKFGWPAVPADIHQAALIQSARLAARAKSPEGIIGSAEWGVRNLSRRDPDVWNLIEPYILPGFG